MTPPEKNTFSVGETTFEIILSDITHLDVDAIVNPTNVWMIMPREPGTVSGAIFKEIGDQLLEDVKHTPLPLSLGEAVVTPGHSLLCEHIVHVSVNGNVDEERRIAEENDLDSITTLRLQTIGDCISNVMAVARERDINSIAFPLLGSGSLRIDPRLTVEAMINILMDEVADTPIKKVYIVVYQQEALIENLRLLAEAKLRFDPSGNWQTKGALIGSTLGPVGTVMGGLLGGLVGAFFPKAATPQIKKKLEKESASVAVFEQATTYQLPPSQAENQPASPSSHFEISKLREKLKIAEEEIERLTATAPETELAETEVLRTVPLPVAYAIGMVDADLDPFAQFENLRKALSVVLRYLGTIALAEYKEAGCFDDKLNKSLKKSFMNPLTDGTWKHISSEIARAYKDDEPIFLKEIHSTWFRNKNDYSDAHGAFEFLIKERNNIHDGLRSDEGTVRQALDKMLPKWRRAIDALEPLLSYSLFSVDRILDFDSDDKINYIVRWLTGNHIVPKQEIVNWTSRLRTNQIYLMNGDEEPSFLSLTPFLQYEHCSLTRVREMYSLEEIGEDKMVLSTFRFAHRIDKVLEEPVFPTGHDAREASISNTAPY